MPPEFDPDDRGWRDGNSHQWIFATRQAKAARMPHPCSLCYHPLDAWGCCPACERRAEQEAVA